MVGPLVSCFSYAIILIIRRRITALAPSRTSPFPSPSTRRPRRVPFAVISSRLILAESHERTSERLRHEIAIIARFSVIFSLQLAK